MVAGAPHLGVAWRLPGEAGLVASISTRLPSAATEVSLGSSLCGGPACEGSGGWQWVAGASAGLVATRGPGVALSVAPWARQERRGRVHGGVQVAAPGAETRAVAAAGTGGGRLRGVGELFLGSQRDRGHVVAVGGAGWAWMTGTPAGSLVVQGTVQVGVAFGSGDETVADRDDPRASGGDW